MSDNFQEFIDRLRIEEDKVLAEKTSWGRTELKIALEAAKTNTVISMFTQQNKSDDTVE
jgi:hypothetical protein